MQEKSNVTRRVSQNVRAGAWSGRCSRGTNNGRTKGRTGPVARTGTGYTISRQRNTSRRTMARKQRRFFGSSVRGSQFCRRSPLWWPRMAHGLLSYFPLSFPNWSTDLMIPMNRYRNVPGNKGPSRASPNTLCQKCLKRDMSHLSHFVRAIPGLTNGHAITAMNAP